MLKILNVVLLLILGAAPALAQSVQLAPGQLMGNAGSTVAPARPTPFAAITGGVASYPTLAAAAAANIPAVANIVTTLGRVIVGVGGGSYIRISPSTAAAWRFQSADGQWWALSNTVITPEMFAASCDGSTDDTQAFADIATYLNTAAGGGGLRVEMTHNAVCKVWPGATPPAAALVNLHDINGLTWNFNGAQISTSNTSGAFGQQWVFNFANVGNVVINDYNYVQTTWTVLSPTSNAIAIRVGDAAAPWSNNIIINNMTVNGATAGLQVTCGATVATIISGCDTSGITIHNAKISNTYYPLSFQAAGDNFVGKNIVTSNSGREYFPWNVSNHYVELTGDGGGPFDQLLLQVYGLPAASTARNTLANIQVKYQNRGRINGTTSTSLIRLATNQYPGVSGSVTALPVISNAANNGSGLVRLTVSTTAQMATGQRWYVNGIVGSAGSAVNGSSFLVTVINGTTVDLQASTFSGTYTSGGYMAVPVFMKNIDVALDVSTTSTGQPTAVVTSHADGVAASIVPLGVTMDNVKIGGKLAGYTAAAVIPAIDFLTNTVPGRSEGVWTGEVLRNLSLRDLVITGDATVLVNASPVTNNMLLENVSAVGTAWTVTGTNYRQKNVVVASGITDARTVVPSAAVATQYMTEISAAGVISRAQPSFSDIAGSVACAQMPAFTGDVTRPAGSCVTTLATAQPAVHTWTLAQTFTVAPVFTDQSGSRTALGLGTAAVQNIGTSGVAVAMLNGANTWGATQTFAAAIATTLNGNTFTTGTGTLTLGAGKTATISNTLTFTGTDGSTLNVGTGGTLGTNAYTSTAYAPLASPTFTGTATIPTLAATTINAFTLGGAISGGGNQINNVVIGTSTPLAGTFTTITGNTSISSPIHAAAAGLTFQSNGSTFAGSISTGQQWFMGATSNTPPANAVLTLSKNAAVLPNTLASSTLQIGGADGTTGVTIGLQAFNNTNPFGQGAVHYFRARGTAAAPAAAQSGDSLGANFAFGYATSGGAGYVTNGGAGFIMRATDNYTSTVAGASLEMYYTPTGTAALTLGATLQGTGGFNVGTTAATLATSELGLNKISASGTAPGAGTGKLAIVAGTIAGTCKLIMYAGTSTTATTVIDNVGGGC